MDVETVRHVAKLAKIELTNDELSRFSGQLGQILQYIQKLEELSVGEVLPMCNPHDLHAALREDVVRVAADPKEVLGCAPEQAYDHFKVPQVL